jgi:hypothetical protein
MLICVIPVDYFHYYLVKIKNKKRDRNNIRNKQPRVKQIERGDKREEYQ